MLDNVFASVVLGIVQNPDVVLVSVAVVIASIVIRVGLTEYLRR